MKTIPSLKSSFSLFQFHSASGFEMRAQGFERSEKVACFTSAVILHTNYSNHITKSGMKVAVLFMKMNYENIMLFYAV